MDTIAFRIVYVYNNNKSDLFSWFGTFFFLQRNYNALLLSIIKSLHQLSSMYIYLRSGLYHYRRIVIMVFEDEILFFIHLFIIDDIYKLLFNPNAEKRSSFFYCVLIINFVFNNTPMHGNFIGRGWNLSDYFLYGRYVLRSDWFL